MTSIDVRVDNKPTRRAARTDYALIQQSRPRSLVGQVSAVLFQPAVFYRTLPAAQAGRQWLLIAVMILALVGLSAVRQAELAANADAPTGVSDFSGMPPGADFGGGGGVAVEGIPGGAPIDAGIPPDVGFPGGAPAAEETTTAGTWTIALMAAANVGLAWIIQAILLSEVSLFNGRAPRLGLNFQAAIWAGIPLALMAALQLLFLATGGAVGEAGLTGLLIEWEGFATQSPVVQTLLVSAASQATVFTLWNITLLYFAGRYALNGRAWAAFLVVVAWLLVLILVPVATGAVEVPAENEATPAEGGRMDMEAMPFDPSMLGPNGEVIVPEGIPAPGMSEDGVTTEFNRVPLESAPVEGDITLDGQPSAEMSDSGDQAEAPLVMPESTSEPAPESTIPDAEPTLAVRPTN